MTSGGVRPAKPARPELSAKRASGNAPRLSFGEWAVTRGHRIVAPNGARTKRAGMCRRPGKCAALAVTHISPKEAKSTHRPAGSPVAGPTYRTPATSTLQTPFGSQSRPLGDPEAQELRPQSSLNSRHLLRGIGFRSLASTVAAEHELAGLVSFDYGQRA